MIRLDRVTKLYPSSARPALDDVSLNVDKGEFVFLIGPSGSAKSTFLRLLLKEENPTRGRVQVAGKDLGRLSRWKVPALRRTIGCVFQDFRLLEKKSVADNVGFALEVIGKPAHTIRKVVPEVLEPARSSTGRWSCSPTSRPETSTPTPARTSCCCSSASTGREPRS